MVYPGKISAETIKNAALVILDREGSGALTLRRVANDLGVVPNAIYRYYQSREILMAALADEAARRLIKAIKAQVGSPDAKGLTPAERVQALCEVYVQFARKHPALYETLMTDMAEAEASLSKPLGHDLLWETVIEIIETLSGRENGATAAVTLWGMLHGLWVLERSRLLGGKKPTEVGRAGIEAFLKGIACMKSR